MKTSTARRLDRLAVVVEEDRAGDCHCPHPLVVIPERGDRVATDPCSDCGRRLRFVPIVIGCRDDGPQ